MLPAVGGLASVDQLLPLAVYLPATSVENGYYLLSRERRADIKKRHFLAVVRSSVSVLSPSVNSGHEEHCSNADGGRHQSKRVMCALSAGYVGIRWVVLNRQLVTDFNLAPKPTKLHLGRVPVAGLIGERNPSEVDRAAKFDLLHDAGSNSVVQVQQDFVDGEPTKDEEQEANGHQEQRAFHPAWESPATACLPR